MTNISFLQLAEQTLTKAKIPLTDKEIWNKSVEFKISKETTGKTPWATLASNLYIDIRDNPDTIFYKHSTRPTKFFLKNTSIKSEKVIKNKELIYTIQLRTLSKDFIEVKIGHTTNIKKRLNDYKTTCEPILLGLWYSNSQVNVNDCEKGILILADNYSFEGIQERKFFSTKEFEKFKKHVNMLLKPIPIDTS